MSYISSDDKKYLSKNFQRLKTDASRINVEFRLFLPDKSVKWVQLKAFDPQEKGKVREIAGFLEDINRRKEYELSLYNIK